MTESTRILITQEQLDSLLLNYYKKEYNDETIKITRTVSTDAYHDDVVSNTINRKLKIGDYEAEKKYGLGYKEIENVLNKELEQYGYKVSNFYYEISNKKVVGVSVFVNELQKAKQKILR